MKNMREAKKEKKGRKGKKVLYTIVITLIVLFILPMIIGQIRKIISKNRNEVSKIVTYQLNGEDQKVLIEGKEKDLPILVMLHGGPCFNPPFNEGCRGMFPEITDSYLTVYWDQLGCGKNRKKYPNGSYLPNDISSEDYVLMLKDLLTNLRNDYPGQKVYLFGISWGSFLTAHIAAESPELVDGVLVYGQVRGNMFQTQDVMDGILQNCKDEKDIEFLESCKSKDVLTEEEIFQIESMIPKYTDGFIYQGKTGIKQSNSRLILTFLQYFFSPDYSYRDAVGSLTDNKCAKQVSIQLLHSDLTETLANVKVPYKILQGEKDLQTSRHQIEEFMSQYKNPNITYQMVPNCGHIPTTECFSVIIKEIQNMKEQ